MVVKKKVHYMVFKNLREDQLSLECGTDSGEWLENHIRHLGKNQHYLSPILVENGIEIMSAK